MSLKSPSTNQAWKSQCGQTGLFENMPWCKSWLLPEMGYPCLGSGWVIQPEVEST